MLPVSAANTSQRHCSQGVIIIANLVNLWDSFGKAVWVKVI